METIMRRPENMQEETKDFKLLSFRLETDLFKRIQETAKKNKLSVNTLIKNVLEDYMKLIEKGN